MARYMLLPNNLSKTGIWQKHLFYNEASYYTFVEQKI